MHVDARGIHMDLTEPLAEHIQRSVEQALDRFSSRIQQVQVRLEDINGPRHGHDMKCHVEIQLRRRDRVVVEYVHEDAYAAVDCCMGRAKRAVRRKINRLRDAHRSEARSAYRAA